jgi:hypothetical protein
LRCKVCSLPKGKRVQVERWVRGGTSLRQVSEILNEEGIMISYGGIFRHATDHIPSRGQAHDREIDRFVESMQEYRPMAITVNVDKDIRTALVRRRRIFQDALKRSGYRRRATTSSVVNYFLRKGAEAIRTNSAEADRVLHEFVKQRASFIDARHRRAFGRPVSAMISKDVYRRLQVDIPSAVWFSKPHGELRELWNAAVGNEREERWVRLPNPSLTDYCNLILRAGLEH